MNKHDILNMLNYNQSENIQKLGMELALKENNLDFFLEYAEDARYGENCAKIFSNLDYEKIIPYLDEMFSWIEDLNTVGAQCIFEYLKTVPGVYY